MYGRIGDSEKGLCAFTELLQIQVCKEFRINPSVGVELIRAAVALFPDDTEIKVLPTK